MATFILIGISCDNVFVIFDAWYSEKLDLYNRARLQNQTVEFYGKLTKQQERQYGRDRDYTMSVKARKKILRNEKKDEYNEEKDNIEIDSDNNDQEEEKEEDEDEEEYFDRIKNPDLIRMMKVNDEQMIQMMGGLLRHAAASVFVRRRGCKQAICRAGCL